MIAYQLPSRTLVGPAPLAVTWESRLVILVETPHLGRLYALSCHWMILSDR